MDAPPLTVLINGEERTIEPTGPTAVEAIRDGLGLTGTKLACGGGQCGSCVIAVDGVPVASCLLPVEDLAGAQVTTVEGIGGESLHPVQRAFIAHDALQCGFCTPGFVVEAATFCDRWRAERGDIEPGDDDIHRALAGHLCRCGAYPSIRAAVRDACAGRFDDQSVPIGRPDALSKVTGSARYTVDVRLPDMAYGVVIRSAHAHAELQAVDISESIDIEGFLAFVDLLDGERHLRYVGQPIGAVAAESRSAAENVAAAVVVTARPLPAATTIDEAIADDAPDIHGRGWRPPSSNEAAGLPNVRRGNLRGPVLAGSTWPWSARRRLNGARQRTDPLLVERTYRVQPQAHTPLEAHACVADWNRGEPVVYVSTQAVGDTARTIAERFGIEPEAVTVLAEHVGGAFGAKQGVTEELVAAVKLSHRCDVPVSVVYDRAEELTVGGHRPGGDIELALLGDAGRELSAFSITSRANGGASAGQYVATWARLMYPGAPRVLLDYDVVTNRPLGKPFRAPGGPPVAWALEQAVDELAGRLGVDPVALRQGWDPSPLQSRVLDWVAHHPRWRDRPAPGRGRHRRGVGVALSTWFYGFDPAVRVQVRLDGGRIEVRSASQDMGNGTRTVLRDAVGERLGLPLERIDVKLGDSRFVKGPTSASSRTTASLWPAAVAAAGELTERMVAHARGMGLDDAVAGDGGVVHAGELIPWVELVDRMPALEAEAGRPRDERRPFLPVPISGLQVGWGLTHAAHLVEVEVDTETGVVRPMWAGAGVAVGRIHAHRQARSQVEGGIVQGLSFVLHEEWLVDPATGIVTTSDLDSYRIAGIADIPDMEVHFIEDGFEGAAGEGVGLSELSTVGVAAAVGNAVAAATGSRRTALPIRPMPEAAL